MGPAGWKAFCMSTFPGTFPQTQDGLMRIDTIWADMLKEAREARGKQEGKIGFKEFHDYGLYEIMKCVRAKTGKEVTFDSIQAKVMGSSPVLDATKAEATRFHDDKDNYTGTHHGVHGGASKSRNIGNAGW